MARVRLFERLNRHASERKRRRPDDKGAVSESVRNYICQILSTRQGNVPIDPDFGLAALPRRPEAGESADRGQEIADAVRELIKRYEPRVQEVEVRSKGFSSDRMGLGLDIVASVQDGTHPPKVRLTGTLLMEGVFIADRS